MLLLQASGLAANITNDTAWTILAPTNTAFIDRLATLGLTPQQLLLPENNATLNEVRKAVQDALVVRLNITCCCTAVEISSGEYCPQGGEVSRCNKAAPRQQALADYRILWVL